MNVGDVIIDYLKRNGFDGLVSGDAECGCVLEDLASCGESPMSCEPGYKVPCGCGEGCGWDIATVKPKKS